MSHCIAWDIDVRCLASHSWLHVVGSRGVEIGLWTQWRGVVEDMLPTAVFNPDNRELLPPGDHLAAEPQRCPCMLVLISVSKCPASKRHALPMHARPQAAQPAPPQWWATVCKTAGL